MKLIDRIANTAWCAGLLMTARRSLLCSDQPISRAQICKALRLCDYDPFTEGEVERVALLVAAMQLTLEALVYAREGVVMPREFMDLN